MQILQQTYHNNAGKIDLAVYVNITCDLTGYQEVQGVGVVHLSPMLQRLREARREERTALPLEGGERPHRLPPEAPEGL